ncbi:MAG: purine-nucleoside phosphorylase [Desulfobacca sp. RBG_16_58_9]|nr:MAG: purine-nucleoside phosphorylase [Desulfobacca sp. RBG_16_58_9]
MLSQNYQEQVAECARFLAPRLERPPEWGIVLGTGQSLWDSRLEGGECLPYEALPHFPPATSPSHHGRLCWGRLAGRQVMVCQGRFHAYEGYSMGQVTFPVRVMATLGVKTLVLTNAAGGLNPHFRPGELMLICDHINFMGDNPLVGPNLEAWGPRFPDLSRVYDLALRELAAEVARRQGTVLRQGVYVAVKGPSLETPAETRFLRMMGADAVGMSTVPEAICAVHAGLRILGISVISNLNLPDAMAPIAIEDIIATVARAEPALAALLLGIMQEVP